MTRYEIINGEVELFFDENPGEETLAEVKKLKMHWNRYKKCWHGARTEKTELLAKTLCSEVKHDPFGAERCCYYNSVESFLKEEEATWLECMQKKFKRMLSMPLEKEQIDAWKDCFAFLQDEMPRVNEKHPGLQIIFEYVLPYESGRRPDVILLSKEYVVVLEFKQFSKPSDDAQDQVGGYVRDLKEYHLESREKQVIPVLVLTRGKEPNGHLSNVLFCYRGSFENSMDIIREECTPCDAKKWMDSKYEPLPSIVEAAKSCFRNTPLPSIRRVNSTGIPKALEQLKQIADDARKERKHVLALVTGVPGAGKTYLGLQYVQECSDPDEGIKAIYLSGNKYLIEVLRDALSDGKKDSKQGKAAKAFVKNILAVVGEFVEGRMGNEYENNILVFDEGQRAWNAEKMREWYKRHNCSNQIKSEPEELVKLCDEKLEWCVLLVLVGEGQEIYKGENLDLQQWKSVFFDVEKEWDVVCPEKIKDLFSVPVNVVPELNLSQSLRSHTAGDASAFVNDLLSGELVKDHLAAKNRAQNIIQSNYVMYFTRDVEEAKKYCRSRYEEDGTKKFGMIASSTGGCVKEKKKREKGTSEDEAVAWFNKPTSDLASSNALNNTITEFACQGLEVDMPIILWGNDLGWTGSKWEVKNRRDGKKRTKTEEGYCINSYRVLLTRGRDGFIVYLPSNSREMDKIAELFDDVGIQELHVEGK